MQIYTRLVNRHAGIAYRYHKLHDGAHGVRKVISWVYLLWLNLAHDVFFCRWLAGRPGDIVRNKVIPPLMQSESEAHLKAYSELSVEEMVRRLEPHTVISFDVFDTLIFRPLSKPTDLFYYVGEKLSYMGFRKVRIKAETKAREKSIPERGHAEVTLEEIWEELSKETGLDKDEGMRVEIETEEALCYANPFMREVWNRLIDNQKRIIVTTDMYLPETCIRYILEKNGFTGMERIFVSGEYGKSKADGKLFSVVSETLGTTDVIHVGDNEKSDREMAERRGFSAVFYPSPTHAAAKYRPQAMSFLIGSAYRGVVSNHLYHGLTMRTMEYEYGFLFGGLFVLGYCRFIHAYCQQKGIEKILFLSRDGDTLRRAYEMLYPEDDFCYALWSRKAAMKLMAVHDRHDFFRRFVFHKVNQGYSLRDILRAMELDEFLPQLAVCGSTADEEVMHQSQGNGSGGEREPAGQPGGYGHGVEERAGDLLGSYGLCEGEELTDRNAPVVKKLIEDHWETVRRIYGAQSESAKQYYQELIGGKKQVAAVDIGWAGSGALSLSYLFEHVWKLPCEVVGILAGTNGSSEAEPDATEPFRQSGKLVSYLFSPAENRDLYAIHDAGKGYNVFWELLLSSTEPQLAGFSKDGPVFGETDKNPEGIAEIRRGILDFVEEYRTRFRDFPYMLHIEGRDAYAPLLFASGKQERYLGAIAERFDLHVNVD